MSPVVIFNLQLILGYVAWLLCFRAYAMPKLTSLSMLDAQRVIATVHSFRFFGLVFVMPGVVGNLPAAFAVPAAYWDFATALLAMLALTTFRVRPLFLVLTVAFNLVGMVDIIFDYYHAVQNGVPEAAGQMGAAYVIPIIYVPVLMITHVIAFYLLLRRAPKNEQTLAGAAAAIS